jgi:hypothetical protein
MSVSEDLIKRLNWNRDNQERVNAKLQERITSLESEVNQLRARTSVLTRILISKKLATAEEIANALAELSAPPPEPEPNAATGSASPT